MTYEMMSGAGYLWGWAGMAFGGLMMIFWIALFVGLIVLLVRWLGGTGEQRPNGDALDTLKQRFARGEVDTAEFQERSQQLRGGK